MILSFKTLTAIDSVRIDTDKIIVVCILSFILCNTNQSIRLHRHCPIFPVTHWIHRQLIVAIAPTQRVHHLILLFLRLPPHRERLWFFLGGPGHYQVLFGLSICGLLGRLLCLRSHLPLEVEDEVVEVLALLLHPLGLLLLVLELHGHVPCTLLLPLLLPLDRLHLRLHLLQLLVKPLHVDLVVLHQVLQLKSIPLDVRGLVHLLGAQLLQFFVQQEGLVT